MQEHKITPIKSTYLIVLASVMTLAACGNDGPSGATTPTSPTTQAVGANPRVLTCSQVSYQGTTQSVQCSVPGQATQPSGLQIFFPGRTDCLIVSCSNGCASSVRAGTNASNTCR